MSLPPLLNDTDVTAPGWGRKVQALLNLVVRHREGVGVTAERPRGPDIGAQFYDTTLGRPVWWSGSDWRDASGAVA